MTLQSGQDSSMRQLHGYLQFRIASQLALGYQATVVGRGPPRAPLLLTAGLLELDLSVGTSLQLLIVAAGPLQLPSLTQHSREKPKGNSRRKRGSPSSVDTPSVPQISSSNQCQEPAQKGVELLNF